MVDNVQHGETTHMDARDAAGIRRDLALLGQNIALLAEAVEQVGNGLAELARGQTQNGQNLGAAGAHTARRVRASVPTR